MDTAQGPTNWLVSIDQDTNATQHVTIENLKMDSNMVWLLFSLVTAVSWVIYITFYNSRVVGYIITKIINRLFIKHAFFKIGSISFNPIAGKVMFRDVVYVCFDYSVRIQDGYMIFRWWRSYVPKDVSEDLSHSDTRLSVMLNGFELHVYNRSNLYAQVEKTFGLPPSMLLPYETMQNEEIEKLHEVKRNLDSEKLNMKYPSAYISEITWRDLIPVIKLDICSGRVVFGNRLTPTTLSVCVEEAHCVYSTKKNPTGLDKFMHFVKMDAENAKVLLAPSPKYTGLIDEPPRFMGEGFVVMMSNYVQLYFYMDEPGVVPETPLLWTLANGDQLEAPPPVWGVDIKCGKGTDFSYGPWADRQRDHLFKFFFPPDWQEMVPTPAPQSGELRQYHNFDISLCTLNEATIDILFSKNKETNATHVIIGPGSYLDVTLPWVTQAKGYTTKVSGVLLHVEATTSLQYRSLAECESLEFKARVHYPLRWNDHQEWIFNLTGSKATAYIIYEHKQFFQDLIEDWSSKARPDILTFVPYTWKFSILLKEFEILTLCNEYNWIDCSSANQENNHLAFCGDLFDLSFNLPFDDFLPQTVSLSFWIHGEGLDLSLFLPETSTSRPIVLALDKNLKVITRDGKEKRRSEMISKKWRKVCQRSNDWIDCWSVPIVALSIHYVYHPMPPLGPDPQANITTPEKEELLLSPIRIPKMKKTPTITWIQNDVKFDPLDLTPDTVTVDVEIGSSILMAYGSVLADFINLKENIFGEDQVFTDMEQVNSKINASKPQMDQLKNQVQTTKDEIKVESSLDEEDKKKIFDPRAYRPLNVNVTVTIHDIQAHLVKNCSETDPPCPIVLIERLGFEMKKSFTETELQVLVSPAYLICSDNVSRSNKDRHLRQGQLLLSAVQVRGHAMFSNETRTLDEETLEYAWLLEVQLGTLSGKITLTQMCHIITGLETFLLLLLDSENKLKTPKTSMLCHHGEEMSKCDKASSAGRNRCPSFEEIKYKMTRVAIDKVDIFLAESGTAMHATINPIRLSACNLHGVNVKAGLTCLIPSIKVQNYVSTSSSQHSATNSYTNGSNHSSNTPYCEAMKVDEKRDSFGNMRNPSVFDSLKKLKRGNSQFNHYGTPLLTRSHNSHGMEKEDVGGQFGKRWPNDHGHHSRYREYDSSEIWLETGSVSLGPIIIESASAIATSDLGLHLIQHNYLKLHDDRWRRLWFLWAPGSVTNVKCGCVGGCAFFGSNLNGPKFFKPSGQDLTDGTNLCVYNIHANRTEYGFGQSILNDNQLVFHTPPYTFLPLLLTGSYTGSLSKKMRAKVNRSITLSGVKQGKEISCGNLNLKYKQDTIVKTPEMDRGDSSNRRFSYSCNRQNVSLNEVPYARLIDTPSNISQNKESVDPNRATLISNRQDSDSKLLNPKVLWIPAPKTSASDSKLTMDYFLEKEASEKQSQTSPPSQIGFDSTSSSKSSTRTLHRLGSGRSDVQRTISLTSENPSETFFSADEDNLQLSSPSPIAENVAVVMPKKRFSSDISIMTQFENDKRRSINPTEFDDIHTLPQRPQSTTEFMEENKRISNLATPARQRLNLSPKLPHLDVFNDTDSKETLSSSDSLSSNSFISAMSSQEDMSMVNLHMQTNKPIVDSPLLMASYMNHLAQMKCSNWSCCSFPYGADAFSIPMFQSDENGKLFYVGSSYIPHYELNGTGHEIRIVSRYEPASGNSTSTRDGSLVRAHPYDPCHSKNKEENSREKKEDNDEFMSLQIDPSTRNSIIIRSKGAVNIMVSPLLLEGLQRMIEIATITISGLNPLTVINHLHYACISKVEDGNILKRNQSTYWSQVSLNSKRSTAERNMQGVMSPVLTDIYEENISSQLQISVIFSKVNITMIQSSIIEEVISFAALDNVQDLTCASLVAFSVEDIYAKFHFGKTTKASMHTVNQPSIRSSGLKKSGLIKGTRALWAQLSNQNRQDNIPGDPILIETLEKQLEEMVVTIDVGKIHLQLRRLKNDETSTSQDSQKIVTAIPFYKSKAMFDCLKYVDETSPTNFYDLGYIMCECGLEGVSVKIIKRNNYEKIRNANSAYENEINLPGTSTSDKSQKQETTSNIEINITPGPSKKTDSSSKINLRKPLTPILNVHREKTSTVADSKPKENEQPKKEGRYHKQSESGSQAESSKTKAINADGPATNNNNGKTSSCIIDFKLVWFNFAAPPRAPITRKIDFTRLDWNLLSTASSTITAWMNPCNRFAIKLVAMCKSLNLRHAAIAASLMADALDAPGVQKRNKGRHFRLLTPFSKTLQDDPSCQLCTVMQRYVLQKDVRIVEKMVDQSYLPNLNTLKQAIIVLSRQWKNTLYNPLLFEHQYRSKLVQQLNIPFTLMNQNEDLEDGDFETEPENEFVQNISKHMFNNDTEETEHEKLLESHVKSTEKIDAGFELRNPRSSRASLNSNSEFFPITTSSIQPNETTIGYKDLQNNDENDSISSTGDSIQYDINSAFNHKEDLYSWFANQEKSKRRQSSKFRDGSNAGENVPNNQQCGVNNFAADSRLLDAHLIFEPILTCLGVMPQQMVNDKLVSGDDLASLEHWDTNLSLNGSLEVIRIDIVVSEGGDKKGKGKTTTRKTNGKFSANSPAETPAFLCERVGIELEVLKIASDMKEDIPQNVVYLSRNDIRKNSTTVVNISLNLKYISQQVNMPLLRLLHQITNMYQNVKDAQEELKDYTDIVKKVEPLKIESGVPSDIVDATFSSIDNSRLSTHVLSSSDVPKSERVESTIPLNTSSSRSRIPLFGQLTPSPNSKNKPQTFVQKFKSTSKTVKGKLGYTNLSETIATPTRTNYYDSADSDIALDSFQKVDYVNIINELPSTIEEMEQGQKKSISPKSSHALSASSIPNCWKTIYNLLELYAITPETKTVTQKTVSPDGNYKQSSMKDDMKSIHEKDVKMSSTPIPSIKNAVLPREKTRMVVFAIARIQKTRLLATLSGLKLEAEISALYSSVTCRKKTRPISLECSLTGQVGKTMIVLLEGTAPTQQTVVKVTVGKSQTLYSSVSRRGKDKNNGLLSIGPVSINIPQHPVALHGMMTRSSRQLSSTLQELRVTRTSARLSRQTDENTGPSPTHPIPPKPKFNKPGKNLNSSFRAYSDNATGLIQPLVMNFNILLHNLSISAALLPSLMAEYKMENVSSSGVTGNKAKFIIDLPSHSLSFNTKIQSNEINLPSEASIALPPVHVSAEYIQDPTSQEIAADGMQLHNGGYVSAAAEIGDFERCLTTDLLNHLVFVQKVFMKEVNEVIQKVYGGEKPVPLWLEESDDSNTTEVKRILFNLNLIVKRIQLTATTACSSAVRFETGAIEFQLSNRVKNSVGGLGTKLIGKAQIELNLSLGQIIKNVIFDEAEPEFQQYAFFNTSIGLRNSIHEEMQNFDKELVLITLKRPLIYVQPVAIDKAILVWLNYKNAYDYWAEKRANLNKDGPSTGQQVFERVQFSHLGPNSLSTLFLQLRVEDMGICVPLTALPTTWPSKSYADYESRDAVVITLENTMISACNSGSLVSNGKFTGLCLRFADDFEATLDDWKPNMNDASIMNLCVVSEGTYEVSSRTIGPKTMENAKWLLNVQWKMEGVDIHLDTNIGKQLSALGHTLTTLTGFEEDDPPTIESPESDECDTIVEQKDRSKRRCMENFPAFVFDSNLDAQERSLLMEIEMKEQLKIINDLRTLGASHNTITAEEKRLQELQAISYRYFRRDMMQKWKKPNMRKAMLDMSQRSQSCIAPSPTYDGIVDLIPHTLENTIKEDASSSENLKSLDMNRPSRTSSLKVRGQNKGNRTHFAGPMRQSSLPSAESEDSVSAQGYWPTLGEIITPDASSVMVNIDGEEVELRNKKSTQQTTMKQQEPNIDFELDIKVLVSSGKCVLHTKDIHDERMSVSSAIKQHRRERSLGTQDWGSPVASRKHKDKSRLKYSNYNNALVDLTIFHIPGLDVKLHYDSKIIPDLEGKHKYLEVPNTVQSKRFSAKKAALFAWITLHSIPEETIISPHILEFLEQTLEPISKDDTVAGTMNAMNLDLLEGNYVTYASFPVDVIVYFHMQPSTFRFSCLPVSRVECMLQLPSLDLVFSSKRTEESENKDNDKGTSGGLSVTGGLADFNVYIFHPYGGKKAGHKDATQFSPLVDNERKDSLSINVEFVKFHITRSRRNSLVDPIVGKLNRILDQPRAVIRFSSIIDIGSASFKYDMRRLTEILAFPKAWYRRRIMRRLFLGDVSISHPIPGDGTKSTKIVPELNVKPTISSSKSEGDMKQDDTSTPKMHHIGKTPTIESTGTDVSQGSAWETLVLFAVNFKKLNVQMNMGNVMGNVIWLTKGFSSDGRLSIDSSGYKNMYIGIGLGGSSFDAKGGIVGGNFELNKIDNHMHFKEQPGVEPHHTIGIKLMALELRLDYMGTSVLMTRISSLNIGLHDEWKSSKNELVDQTIDYVIKRPAVILIHGELSWDQLQIMISKSTTADVLKMYYKLEEFFTQQFKSSKRVFSILDPRNAESKRAKLNSISISENAAVKKTEIIQVIGSHHRHWQKPLTQAMGLILASLGVSLPNFGTVLGGTMQLHGRHISLACFHGINFKSKFWALFSMKEPCINFATEAQQIEQSIKINIKQTLTFGLGMNSPGNQPPKYQNHSMATVCRISRNMIFPPQFKTLHEWFHYAFANSDIDAIDRFPLIEKDKELNTNSIERSRNSTVPCSPKLQDHAHNREVIFAFPSLQLHFKTEHYQEFDEPKVDSRPLVECSFITDFEDHIFVTVDAEAFFFLHDLITSYLKEKEKVIGAQSIRSASPNPQGSSSTTIEIETKNNTKDASQTKDGKGENKDCDRKDNSISKSELESFVKDWRNFECKTWHLEPTVRLLSWAGKSIEPYGIDYILNKLGFSHARITIPKWLQRGFMDPLDKLQALLMMQLLLIVKENRKQSSFERKGNQN